MNGTRGYPSFLQIGQQRGGADIEGVAKEHQRGLQMQAPGCVGQLAAELKAQKGLKTQIGKEHEKLKEIKNTPHDAAGSKEYLNLAVGDHLKKAIDSLVAQEGEANERNRPTLINEMTAIRSLRALREEFDKIHAPAWKQILKGRVTEQEGHIRFAESQLAQGQKHLAWSWDRLADESAPAYYKLIRPNSEGKPVCDACRVLFEKELEVGTAEWAEHLILLHHILNEENAQKRSGEQKRAYPKQDESLAPIDGGPIDLDTATIIQ